MSQTLKERIEQLKAERPRELFATYYPLVSGGQWLHAHGINHKRNCCEKADWVLMNEVTTPTREQLISVIEVLAEASERLLQRIDHNGGIGEYNGGPAFVVGRMKEALATVNKMLREGEK